MFLIKSVDISGQQFGRLTAISIAEKRNGQEYWLCECSCELGKTKIVRKSHLTGGRIRSCGCLYKGTKRGISQPNTYVINENIVDGIDFKGNHFCFDLSDFETVRPYTWYLNHDGYVVARIDGKNITMHRFLLGDDGETIDHANHCKSDNRRANLRFASTSENVVNRPMSYVGKPVIGVYRHASYKKYEALVVKDGERHPLGFYDDYDDAVRARLQGEMLLFGEFAPQKHLFEKYGIVSEELNV